MTGVTMRIKIKEDVVYFQKVYEDGQLGRDYEFTRKDAQKIADKLQAVL